MVDRWGMARAIAAFLLLGLWLQAVPAWGKHRMTDRQKSDIVQKMYGEYKKNFPDIGDISAAAAERLDARNEVVFIDVRTPEEQAVSELPGAVTEAAVKENPTILEGKTAVAYCTIGYRSGLYVEKMDRRGIHMLNLAGGILAWVLSGGKVYHDGRETKRVHVYGEKWNYAPAGYEAIEFGFFHKLTH